tara:strand:- start:55 stop:306 length:252 start_codon:yes stop_codon:yes gene_type:complete
MGLENDYNIGDKAVYHEDGAVFRVEVLASEGDGEFERYRLKVLDVVSQSRLVPIVREVESGEEFDCNQRRNVAFGGMWYLDNR